MKPWTRWTQEKFIEFCKDKFPGINLEGVVFVSTKAPVTLICQHGERHLNAGDIIRRGQKGLGIRCRSCSNARLIEEGRKTAAHYLPKIKRNYGPSFDYSLIDLNQVVNARNGKIIKASEVIVACPVHGPFKKTISAHMVTACPGCHKESLKQYGGWSLKKWAGLQKGRPACLYIIKMSDTNEEFYKIGITYQSIKNRYNKSLAVPYNIESVVTVFKSNEPRLIWQLEAKIKREHKHCKYNPSLKFGGSQECFSSITGVIEKYLQPLVDTRQGELHYPI